MDHFGSLKYWIKDATNEKKWSWMIESKLRSPHLDIPKPKLSDNPSPPIPQRNAPPPEETNTNTNTAIEGNNENPLNLKKIFPLPPRATTTIMKKHTIQRG